MKRHFCSDKAGRHRGGLPSEAVESPSRGCSRNGWAWCLGTRLGGWWRWRWRGLFEAGRGAQRHAAARAGGRAPAAAPGPARTEPLRPPSQRALRRGAVPGRGLPGAVGGGGACSARRGPAEDGRPLPAGRPAPPRGPAGARRGPARQVRGAGGTGTRRDGTRRWRRRGPGEQGPGLGSAERPGGVPLRVGGGGQRAPGRPRPGA